MLALGEETLLDAASGFAAKAERLYSLETHEVPTAEANLAHGRAALVTTLQKRQTSLQQELTRLNAELDRDVARLTALPTQSPDVRATGHTPYTF